MMGDDHQLITRYLPHSQRLSSPTLWIVAFFIPKTMRDSTIIYRSFYEAIKQLPKEIQAEIWEAICEYSLNIFTLIKPQLDANLKRYENGNKPKNKQIISETEAKVKQTRSKQEANANVNDNVNKNKNVNPSIDDVILYFIENGYGEDLGKKAFNYYSSANWMDSKGKQVKNWKQKMHGVWFKEENKMQVSKLPVKQGGDDQW